MRPLPRYALVGLIIMSLTEVLMLLEVEPFWTWHTSMAWTGYILFADGVVWMRRGDSWLTRAPREFVFLALVSIPLWLVFEFFNLFIGNWRYINLPEHPVVRNFGFAWAFSTIWPAIFVSADMIATLRRPGLSPHSPEDARSGANRVSGLGGLSMAGGLALLVWPLLFPSPYLAAPVWLGFIFLLDPLNAAWGNEALSSDLRLRRGDRLINLILAGLLCGVLWEFWNYWARAKWIYTVPILEEVRIFEMPLPGYLGFAAFALECFTMYVFVRRLIWRGSARGIAL